MLGKKYIYTLIFVLNISFIYAVQKLDIDTSYTVNSAFQKEIKKFPKIRIAKAKAFKNILEIKKIVYTQIGDQNQHLDAYYLKKKTLVPAIILIHGGGWKSGNKSHMEPMAKSIASEGYACFTVEYRLSTQARYPAGVYDVKNAIRFVKENAKKFNIDTTKVAVLGCSSGGQMAALIGTTNNNKSFEDQNDHLSSSSTVQAVIDIDGILAFKHPQSKENVVASQWLGGTYEEKPEVWNNASALNHTDKNTPPTLFINSQFERFHAGRDDMIAILNKFNIYSEVKTIKNSPHTFWLFDPYFNETVDYVTKFLDRIFK